MTTSKQKNLALIYGGPSVEHEISIRSAKSVNEKIDRERFSVHLIFIDKDANWFLNQSDVGNENSHTLIPISLNLDTSRKGFIIGNSEYLGIDVAFPLVHGTLGEDGSIQGLLEVVGIPYVGANVLASSICMNKASTKEVLKIAGVAQSNYLLLRSSSIAKAFLKRVKSEIGYPCMVKPASLGSSVGIEKVDDESALISAVENAFSYDREVLVEEYISGREMECSVLGLDDPKASVAGEVVIDSAKHSFYNYEAKYIDPEGADLIIPAEVPIKEMARIKEEVVKAFVATRCEIMARVDLFYTDDGDIFINEINTIPGFTNISMYAKLWAEEGISYTDLLSKLIRFAIERGDRQAELTTSYQQ